MSGPQGGQSSNQPRRGPSKRQPRNFCRACNRLRRFKKGRCKVCWHRGDEDMQTMNRILAGIKGMRDEYGALVNEP